MIWPLPTDPDSAKQAAKGLKVAYAIFSAGFPTYLVGGCVRDSLLGIPNYDIDICTSAPPEIIVELFPEALPHGPQRYNIFRLPGDSGIIEIAHFRTERNCDGRHCEVELTGNLHLDLARRDFTVNALAVSPENREVIDEFGGIADLSSRLLRTVGEPSVRFAEDRLRILRGIRFAAKLNFKIDNDTRLAIEHEARNTNSLSGYRIRREITSILQNGNSAKGISLLFELGIWPHIFEEIADYPLSNSWQKRLAAIERVWKDGRGTELSWAVLLMPDLSCANDEQREINGLVSKLGFPSSEGNRILTLCQLTNYAVQFHSLDLESKIAIADSHHLDDIEYLLSLLAPENDFKTTLRREFPSLGTPKLLAGKELKAALSGIQGAEINSALKKLRYLELAGKISSIGEAESFLRQWGRVS